MNGVRTSFIISSAVVLIESRRRFTRLYTSDRTNSAMTASVSPPRSITTVQASICLSSAAPSWPSHTFQTSGDPPPMPGISLLRKDWLAAGPAGSKAIAAKAAPARHDAFRIITLPPKSPVAPQNAAEPGFPIPVLPPHRS